MSNGGPTQATRALDWDCAAAILGNIVLATTDTFGKPLAWSVERLLKLAPKTEICQAEIDQTGLAWILDEATKLRGKHPAAA